MMILSAAQVQDAAGPETPGCDCQGCKALVAVKNLICDAVSQYDTTSLQAYQAQRAHDPDAEHPAATWLAVLMVAAARATAQGFPRDIIAATMQQGVENSEEMNVLMRYTANAQSQPI